MPSRSATCLLLAGLLAPAGLAGPAGAKVFLSRQEALAWAFPDADRVDKESVVLTDAQAREVESLARAPLETRIVTLYTAHRDGEAAGYAFIDIHTVRTLPEAFLVVLTPEGEVRTLRVLAFYEPQEYLPPARWLAQFDERGLDGDVRLGGAIHGIAGSTLSARAVTSGVRRTLALFRVLVGREPSRFSARRPEAVGPEPTESGG